MRICFAIVTLLVSALITAAQEPSWTAKGYHVLMDGNALYSHCQSAQKNVRIAGENVEVLGSAGTDLFPAGQCWGYITGVVDSIPAGEGFEPDADVMQSQYVDVVFAYLRDHPEQRHSPAYSLTRNALTEAFPAKPKR
jgi:hypothetical protein